METKKIQDYSNIAVTNLDPEKAKIVNERGIELQRLKKQVEVAIKKAEELGRTDMVKKLEARGQQLDTLLRGKTFKDLSDGGQTGGDTSNTASENNSEESSTKNQTDQDTAEKENSKEEQEAETEENNITDDSDDEDSDSEDAADEEDSTESSEDTDSTDKTDSDGSSGKGNNEDSDSDESKQTNDDSSDIDMPNTTDAGTDTDTADSGNDSADSESSSADTNNEENLDSSETASDSGEGTSAGSETESENDDSNTDRQSEAQDDEDSQQQNQDQTDEDDPVKDIFKRPENTQQQLGGQGQMPKKESRDPTINEIIQELQSISPDGKQGAARALRDILAKRKVTGFSESLDKKVLNEAIEDKSLEDIDDEEFSDFVNTILDEINNVTPVTYSDPDERKVKVKQAMENNLETRDIEMEQEMQVRADKRRKRANQSELDKYVNYRPISEFYIDLYRTIADQVKQVEIDSQSYDEINPEYDDDVIMKADVTQYEQRQEKPSIDFFFDVSGSWEDSDVELGKRFVASLKEFVDRDELELNIYYFSDVVGQDLNTVRKWSGTSAWIKILNTIKSNNARNVVIMTDGDMDGFAVRAGQKCLVEGVVWYIWKIGGYYATGAKELPKYLKGMQGTTQYAFSAKDVD